MTTTQEVELPYNFDRRMKIGSDLSWDLTFMEDDKVTPKTTTGWTMTLKIKRGMNGETYYTKTDSDAEITHTPAAGNFTIIIPKATIDTFDFATAWYEISVYDGVSETLVFVQGNIRTV